MRIFLVVANDQLSAYKSLPPLIDREALVWAVGYFGDQLNVKIVVKYQLAVI